MKSSTQQRPIDRMVSQFDQAQATSRYPVLTYVATVLIMFGLLAFVWAIPFPHIPFLGKYNGFVNWASFLIAGFVYYALKLSPVVSYVVLFFFFASSYLIIQLEYWQKAGGPALWLIGSGVLIIGIIFFILSTKNKDQLRLLLVSPFAAAAKLLASLKVKY